MFCDPLESGRQRKMLPPFLSTCSNQLQERISLRTRWIAVIRRQGKHTLSKARQTCEIAQHMQDVRSVFERSLTSSLKLLT